MRAKLLPALLAAVLLAPPLQVTASIDGMPLPPEEQANTEKARALQAIATSAAGVRPAVDAVAEMFGLDGSPERHAQYDLEHEFLAIAGTVASPRDMQRLRSLPAHVAGALAEVLHAYKAYRQAVLAPNLAPLWAQPAQLMLHGPEAPYAPSTRTHTWGRDPNVFAPIRRAEMQMLEAAGMLSDALAASPRMAFGAPLLMPPTLALDLGGADTTYVDDVALLIDAGGNDLYLNNAGGSALRQLGTCQLIVDFVSQPGAGALLDLAGSDTYLGNGCMGVNGGARLGAGFLLDMAGDDTYSSSARAANGGGEIGAGLLVDLDGNETYTGIGASNGGGSSGGSGFLLDAGGNDAYLTVGGGTNGGGYTGFGTLIDFRGDDGYAGTDSGVNGGSRANLEVARGFLADLGGDDSYRAGCCGSNGGSFTGIGFLFDAGGNDSYTARDVGANGEAEPVIGCFGICYVNHAVGLLMDAGGHDVYSDRAGGTGIDVTVVPKGVVGAQVDVPT